MAITIFGYSDDLVEVEGDIKAEFDALSEVEGGGGLIGFSDGTIIRVTYDEEGIWRIVPVAKGSASLEIVQCTGDDDADYSDRATLDGDIRWVLFGSAMAKRGAQGQTG